MAGNDNDIIAKASGGRALIGIRLGADDDAVAAAAGWEPLLRLPPSGVALLNPAGPTKRAVYCFRSSERSASFARDVRELGWSRAGALHAEFLGFASAEAPGGEASRHGAVQAALGRLQEKASEACIVCCIYVPRKCFRIPRERMLLSDAARARALAIRGANDADAFLAAFAPFVSAATYHLGGVFLRQVTLQSSEQAKLSELFGGGGGGVFGAASVEASSSSSSRDERHGEVERSEERVYVYGPTAARSAEEFQKMMSSDDQDAWCIIDKDEDDGGSVVAVWELLLQHPHPDPPENAVRAAHILCSRWLHLQSSAPPPSSSQPRSSLLLQQQLLQNAQLFLDTKLQPLLISHRSPPAPVTPLIPLPPAAAAANAAARGDPARTSGSRRILGGSGQIRWADAIDRNIGQLCWPHHHHHHRDPTSPVPFRYVGHVIADKRSDGYLLRPIISTDRQESAASTSTLALRYVDCLRHRLDPREHLFPEVSPSTDCERWEGRDGSWSDEDEPGAPDVEEAAPPPRRKVLLEILIHIFQHSELPVQMEVCKLLLARRASTLLVFPSALPAASSSTQPSFALTHCIEAFRFLQVLVDGNNTKLQIHDDVTLPRVFFVSEKQAISKSHSASIASRVMHCDFASQHGLHDEMNHLPNILPTVELGVGFVKVETNHAPALWLCFQVTGPYHHQVMQLIRSVADVIILERLQDSKNGIEWLKPEAFWDGLVEHGGSETCGRATLLQWRETDGLNEGTNKKNKWIWGQETYVVKEITRFLDSTGRTRLSARHEQQESRTRTRTSLLDACKAMGAYMHPRIDPEPIKKVLMNPEHPLSDARQNDLVLQKSLELQGTIFLASLQLKNDPIKKEQQRQRQKDEMEKRRALAHRVAALPMICLFHQILSQDTGTARSLGIMTLDHSISEITAGKNRSDSVKESGQGRDMESLRQAYLQFKQENVDKSIGIENLWRELSHIYEADFHNQRHLVTLAAQHLLDGFPLEVFNGDAGMYCDFWVEDVLSELQALLLSRDKAAKPPRIFVLSVMGLQSSGKSMMLNIMFGTRFPTSAGRCTRGIFMQLIPSEREEYDYVVLLDTEGLRSNEHYGLEGAVARDNRLATFGLLPADACILMVSNEEDSALKDVLPIVLLAFKGSNIAARCGGRLKTKMFFVYRGLDTTDMSRLEAIKYKLYDSLMEAAEEVSRRDGEPSSAAAAAAAARNIQDLIFSDLQVEEVEYWGSDVRFMGSLKTGCVPPKDPPEWNYGKDVLKLRDYIHDRVVRTEGWTPMNPKALGEHLSLVWECISSADFEMAFSSRMEYNHYMELQTELQEHKSIVSRKYEQVFSELVEELREKAKQEIEMEGTANLVGDLEAKVSEVVNEQKKKVDEMLEKPRWSKWRANKEEEWMQSCTSVREWYKTKVEDVVNGLLKYEKVVAEYENRCKSEISNMFDKGNLKWNSSGVNEDEFLEGKFERIFEKFLREARALYPPIANTVRERIVEQYKSHGLTEMFDLGATSVNAHAEDVERDRTWFMMFKNFFIAKIYNSSGSQRHKVDNSRLVSKQEQETLARLQAKIKDKLRYCKQFLLADVDSVIHETKAEISKAGFSREKQTATHQFVRDILISKMTEIQRNWDMDHNVAEKLEQGVRPRLLAFFKGRARGLGATALLIEDLRSILRDGMLEAHVRRIVKSVTNELMSKSWLKNHSNLRNLMDFHLLELMKRKDLEWIIWCVQDEANHKQHVTDILIEHFINVQKEKAWDDVRKKVQYCLKHSREAGEPELLTAFVANLCTLLMKDVDPQLAAEVRDRTRDQAHYSTSSTDIRLDVELYGKEIESLCQELDRMMMPALVSAKLVKKVHDCLKDQGSDACKLTCTHACPFCGSSCYRLLDHKGVKHDCIHQPAGLAGSRYHKTNELVELTCTNFLDKGSSMVICDANGNIARTVPFSDFGKEFPEWMTPGSTQPTAIHVRESVFFHHHTDLAKYYKLKPCPPSKLPPEYDHDLHQLRQQLTSKLRNSEIDFASDEDFATFIALFIDE